MCFDHKLVFSAFVVLNTYLKLAGKSQDRSRSRDHFLMVSVLISMFLTIWLCLYQQLPKLLVVCVSVTVTVPVFVQF